MRVPPIVPIILISLAAWVLILVAVYVVSTW